MAYKNDLAQRQAMAALERHQGTLDEWNRTDRIREGCPKGWDRVDAGGPAPPRARSEGAPRPGGQAKWFWRPGEGYQARMNAVLRAYMLAKAAKMA